MSHNYNIHEKAKRYDIMYTVIGREYCPHCKKEFEFTLTEFKELNMLRGLVYVCPNCQADLILDTAVFKDLHYVENLREEFV